MSEGISSELLDTVVSYKDIGKIATDFLRNWEELSPHLELTPVQEDEIRHTHTDYSVQKLEILRKWRILKGRAATYKAFIAAARAIRNVKLVEHVEDMLRKKRKHTAGNKKQRHLDLPRLHYFMHCSF